MATDLWQPMAATDLSTFRLPDRHTYTHTHNLGTLVTTDLCQPVADTDLSTFRLPNRNTHIHITWEPQWRQICVSQWLTQICLHSVSLIETHTYT